MFFLLVVHLHYTFTYKKTYSSIPTIQKSVLPYTSKFSTWPDKSLSAQGGTLFLPMNVDGRVCLFTFGLVGKESEVKGFQKTKKILS